MNRPIKTVIFWLVIVMSSFLLWQVVKSDNTAGGVPEISYTEFLGKIAGGQVSSVTIAGNVVRGLETNGSVFRVVVPANQTAMLEALQQHGANVRFKEASEQNWPNWLLNLAPLLLLAILWFFMVRQIKRRSPGTNADAFNPNPDSKPRFGP